LQEQGSKTKSCEIEALRAGGGQAPGALHHIICRGIERRNIVKPKLSGFLLNLRRSLEHKGFAKILDISTGMLAVFSNPSASISQHIFSQKIAQLRLKTIQIETGFWKNSVLFCKRPPHPATAGH